MSSQGEPAASDPPKLSSTASPVAASRSERSPDASGAGATYTVPTGTCASGCDYYVVVRGWDGATNTYGISLSVQ